MLLPVVAVLTLVMLFAISAVIASTYRRCPPNAAMLISGLGTSNESQGFKIVVGGGAVVLPLIQHVGYLSLAVHKVEVCTDKPIVCRDGVPIWITVVVEIKVKGDDQSIAAAAEHLFGKAEEECATIVIDVLMGHIQAMAGTLLPRELIQSLNLFSQRVQEIGICDLAKFGLTIVSLHITDVRENAPFSEAEPLDHILD